MNGLRAEDSALLSCFGLQAGHSILLFVFLSLGKVHEPETVDEVLLFLFSVHPPPPPSHTWGLGSPKLQLRPVLICWSGSSVIWLPPLIQRPSPADGGGRFLWEAGVLSLSLAPQSPAVWQPFDAAHVSTTSPPPHRNCVVHNVHPELCAVVPHQTPYMGRAQNFPRLDGGGGLVQAGQGCRVSPAWMGWNLYPKEMLSAARTWVCGMLIRVLLTQKM